MIDFTSVGGVPTINGVRVSLSGDALAQFDPQIAWNFGLRPNISTMPTFAQKAPRLMDRWDGKTSVSLWELGKRLTGAFLPAQRQDRGTCVSRGWSLACNLRQYAQIAAGKREKFQRVSHAVIYGGSREVGGMLGGGDGSFGEAAAKWVSKGGLCTIEEVDDEYTSDVKAIQYGSRGVPADLKKLAIDNLVTDVAMVTSFEEAANAIWSGRPVPVCSDQGFTMTRDADGFCRPSGTWNHCMLFGAVVVLPSGQRGLGCGQSWGQNTPSGPLLLNCPDYVFGVEESVVNRMLGQRDSFTVNDVDGWDDDTIPWIFN